MNDDKSKMLTAHPDVFIDRASYVFGAQDQTLLFDTVPEAEAYAERAGLPLDVHLFHNAGVALHVAAGSFEAGLAELLNPPPSLRSPRVEGEG